MSEFKVVARYRDGRLLKGFGSDFQPASNSYRLVPHRLETDLEIPLEVEIPLPELKGIFFVKDFAGRADYKDRQGFDAAAASESRQGRRVRVRFADGEWMLGTTDEYQLDGPGFFLVPADPRSNIERCFVVSEATRSVALF